MHLSAYYCPTQPSDANCSCPTLTGLFGPNWAMDSFFPIHCFSVTLHWSGLCLLCLVHHCCWDWCWSQSTYNKTKITSIQGRKQLSTHFEQMREHGKLTESEPSRHLSHACCLEQSHTPHQDKLALYFLAFHERSSSIFWRSSNLKAFGGLQKYGTWKR